MHLEDWSQVFAHVDMDAFYVSVELQRRPELQGLPVVVAGSGPRAVVTTASYEARKYGIFSATPAERARRLCPEATFLPPDFEHYRARSREVHSVLRAHVELVESVGLDEAYLDLTGLERPRSAARRVKEAIRADTGLVCSVGIGPNKLVAKVASDADKPDGFVELSAEQARERFADASPGLVPGIGPKTVARLERLGVDHARRARGDSRRPARSSGSAGGSGPHLAALARFEDDRSIETVRVAKSESRETTFDYDLRGLAELEPVLERLTAQLCETLEREERRGRTIGIKLRYADFTTLTRARTLDIAVNDSATVCGVALELLRRLDPRRPVRLLGVRVAGLDEREPLRTPVPAGQMSLSL